MEKVIFFANDKEKKRTLWTWLSMWNQASTESLNPADKPAKSSLLILKVVQAWLKNMRSSCLLWIHVFFS